MEKGNQNRRDEVKRVGMVIRLRPECVAHYRALHADDNPGVRELLAKYHLENFSIFLRRIGEEWYEFGYYEYTGVDFEGDMAALAREPRNRAWLELCDPMQLPLEGHTTWAAMEQIYYNDGRS
jgi:L-rhamnose mutarotase